MVSKKHIESAHQRIQPYIHNTPILTSSILNGLTGAALYFKCENFQKIGAFKARGALNFALQLSKEELKNGLCTHSSGNHAQAVALAAQLLGTKAYIVMPKTAPQAKVDATKGYGAIVTFCEATLQAREDTLATIQQKTKAVFIPPYNHDWIIEGQATCAKEILEELDALDFVITPVGGGGLLAGSALAAKYFSPKTTVIGAEPEGADDAYRSFQTGILIPSEHPNTIADGLLTSLGPINFEIIKQHVSEINLVTDEEIVAAMKLIYQHLKIVVEPSSATVLALVLKRKAFFKEKRIALILSGGN
ncbi:pyridoxal-phosphate dependent enzyme, partial [Salibacteraceae bacterium]|nr:pyridoxal-phosphate dependent enzyme [Salibacteraceae bacterium]